MCNLTHSSCKPIGSSNYVDVGQVLHNLWWSNSYVNGVLLVWGLRSQASHVWHNLLFKLHIHIIRTWDGTYNRYVD